MKILVTGASGLVGTALTAALEKEGHEVVALVRRAPRSASEIRWDPASGIPDPAAVEGADAVVHLAGENIAEGRWTAAKMERIRASRVQGTRTLCEALARLERKPSVLVCASAIGFYGDRGDEVLDEDSAPGRGFLTDVCREWEAACEPAREAGVRVVSLRTGVVLARDGGALAKMLLPFKLGLGGKIGDGKQYMSWIALDDLVRAVEHAIEHAELEGPVNGTAPGAVTNLEYTKTLGRVLSRPTIAPMPAFAARLAFGKMADALLLSSARVVPKRLEETGFRFEEPQLEGALRRVLHRS